MGVSVSSAQLRLCLSELKPQPRLDLFDSGQSGHAQAIVLIERERLLNTLHRQMGGGRLLAPNITELGRVLTFWSGHDHQRQVRAVSQRVDRNARGQFQHGKYAVTRGTGNTVAALLVLYLTPAQRGKFASKVRSLAQPMRIKS